MRVLAVNRRSLTFGVLMLALGVVASRSAYAQVIEVYNTVPKPLPGNVASEGPEAYAFSELGDGFTQSGVVDGTLGEVEVILASWACTSGNWYTGTCITTPDATFNEPITIKVYSVTNVSDTFAPGALLASVTETFQIPYRPSVNPVCGNDTGYGFAYPTQWYSNKDKTCYHGISSSISVNFSSLHLQLPKQIIVTVSYNTTHYGPNPIGQSAPCFSTVSTAPGCPYDSLNISTDTTDGNFHFIGSALDPDGIFVNYTNPANSCTKSAPTGVLALDTAPGCWTGLHPEIKVKANQNTNPKKGRGPDPD